MIRMIMDKRKRTKKEELNIKLKDLFSMLKRPSTISSGMWARLC
jgi:hypothetical protein